MASNTRFGRKIAIPSTRQIKHELRVMTLQDDLRRLEAEKPAAVPEAQVTLDPPRDPA